MLTARANTQLISKAGVATLADFLNELQTQAFTAEDLIAGSHASDEGFLFLRLDSTTQPPSPGSTKFEPVDYEMLEVVDASKTINIPAGVKGADTSFHFKGCAIGSDDSLPFLTLLKHALDNPSSVTAPKYFHGLYEFAKLGIFEFMSYGYRIMSPTPFADIPSLIAAFIAEGFTEELDGTAVPDPSWTTWIKSSLKLAPADSHKVQFNFPVTISPAAGGISAIPDVHAECRSRAEKFPYDLTVTGAMPPDNPSKIALLQSEMPLDPTFVDTHPYPVYQRMHFADFDSFWNGLTWKVASVKGNVIHFVGKHYVYTVVVPVLTPGTSATTNELIYNFYPVTGAPVMNFLEDNAAFDLFGVV